WIVDGPQPTGPSQRLREVARALQIGRLCADGVPRFLGPPAFIGEEVEELVFLDRRPHRAAPDVVADEVRRPGDRVDYGVQRGIPAKIVRRAVNLVGP